jgi:hypothetical protein
MRLIRYIAFGAAAIAALVLLAQPVQASCADAALIMTIDDSVDPAERTFIWTEGFFAVTYGAGYAPYSYGGAPISPNFSAVWWEMGRGAAWSDQNIWNAAWPQGWVYYVYNPTYAAWYGAQIFGGWGQDGVTDCVQDGACTCVLMNDAYGTCSFASTKCAFDSDCSHSCNSEGYWAITGSNNDDAVRTTLLRQPGLDPAGNASPIILRPLPVPFIVGSQRNGNTISVTARVDADATADYQLGTCDCVSGYLLYSQSSAGAPPTDRNVSAGWALVPSQPPAGTPFDQTFQFDINCAGTNEDVYLATQIVGDQGFATGLLSANSSRVECEPTREVQLRFATQTRYPTGDYPRSVAIGNFDSDGRQDLAVANRGSDDVSVLLNRSYLPVEIDIKPPSLALINLSEIPAAILGSESVNAMDVDLTTLRFGPADAVCIHDLTDEWTYNEHLEDVNLDGYMDLMTHFLVHETGITCDDDTAVLSGSLVTDVMPFEGSDSVYLGECRRTRRGATSRDTERMQREQPPMNTEEQQQPGDLVEEQRVD